LTDDDGDRYQRLWDWVEERAPDEPLWYLDTLAVDPARQGEGLGKTLVQFGLAQGLPNQGCPHYWRLQPSAT
jgi:ribosomal protein S18 acetylase RimI-like enzyme